MQHAEAVAVRVLQLQGKPVDAHVLAEALEVIQNTRTPTRRSRTKGTRGGTPEGMPRPPKPVQVPAEGEQA